MNGDLSLWRLIFPSNETENFHGVLSNIRTGENKIQQIQPGGPTHAIDTILTEEELFVMKISIPGLRYCWLRDWIDAKL